MKAYYKVRVVHSPKQETFIVQVKERWWSRWEWKHDYSYWNMSKDTAKRYAIDSADTLMDNTVVYEAGK